MIFEALLLIAASVGILTLLLQVIGASRYDIAEVKQQRLRARQPHARRYRVRPLISIIITTHNDQQTITGCLESLRRSTYRKLEIVIVDNASTDTTKQLIEQYSTDYPHLAIRLVARRHSTEWFTALKAAYQRYGHGDFLVVLDPSDRVQPKAFHAAVRHFQDAPDTLLLLPRTTIRRVPTITSLLQRYLEFLGHRSQKFASSFHSSYYSDAPALYRKEIAKMVLSRLQGKRPQPATWKLPLLTLGISASEVRYAHDVVVARQAQASFYRLCGYALSQQVGRFGAIWQARQLLFRTGMGYPKFVTWFRLPLVLLNGLVALSVPLLLTYFGYLALRLHQPSWLLLSWTVLALLLLSGLWGDNQLRFRQKLGLSFGIPLTYGLLYVLSFVQIAVVLRAAVRPSSA